MVTQTAAKYDIAVKVAGGGITGQADSIALGISRALLKEDEKHKAILRAEGLLTRDPGPRKEKETRPQARPQSVAVHQALNKLAAPAVRKIRSRGEIPSGLFFLNSQIIVSRIWLNPRIPFIPFPAGIGIIFIRGWTLERPPTCRIFSWREESIAYTSVKLGCSSY